MQDSICAVVEEHFACPIAVDQVAMIVEAKMRLDDFDEMLELLVPLVDPN